MALAVLPLLLPAAAVSQEPGIDASLVITKSPSTQDVASGCTATFFISVNGPGAFRVSDIDVTDPMTPSCDRMDGEYENPANSYDYACTTDPLTSTLVNVASATGLFDGEEPVGDESDPATVNILATGISITKTPANQSVLSGFPAEFTIEVTNTGEVPLFNVAVADDLTPDCARDSVAFAELDPDFQPGDSVMWNCSTDPLTDPFTNTATVTADYSCYTTTTTDPATAAITGGGQVMAEATAMVTIATPSIDIEKATNGLDSDAAPGASLAVGDPVDWTYVVTNTGDTALTNIAVTDDQEGTITCPETSLAPAGMMTCSAGGTVTEGLYTNTATVTAEVVPPNSRGLTIPTVEDSDTSNYTGVAASIDIEKATNGLDSDTAPGATLAVGDPVTWTYEVTNNSEVELFNVAVTDDKLGAITCPKDTLAASESMTCTANGTVVAGLYSNTGTVTADTLNVEPEAGTAPTKVTVMDSDDSYYTGADAAIDIEKATNGLDSDAAPGATLSVGDPVTWTYEVTNTGTVDLFNVAVTDDKLGAITCPQDTLAASESMTCTANGTVVAGLYTNTGTVTADTVDTTPVAGTEATKAMVTDSDPSNYTGEACFSTTGDINGCVTGGGPDCFISAATSIDPATLPLTPPPPGVTFPFGLVQLTAVNCNPGATVTFNINYPGNLPAGVEYWKYGPTPSDPTDHWYTIPATFGASSATVSITDGGIGDHDLAADGTIEDPGGPGVAAPVPTLPQWALLLLVAALLAAGVALQRRRADG